MTIRLIVIRLIGKRFSDDLFGYEHGCAAGGSCFDELRSQLLVLLIFNLVVGQACGL